MERFFSIPTVFQLLGYTVFPLLRQEKYFHYNEYVHSDEFHKYINRSVNITKHLKWCVNFNYIKKIKMGFLILMLFEASYLIQVK